MRIDHARFARAVVAAQARFVAAITVAVLSLVMTTQARAADIAPFFGSYQGSLIVPQADGSRERRDAAVKIGAVEGGDANFYVQWTTTSTKPDGRKKTKSYAVEFTPTDRIDIFAAAMKRNVFGHTVQLDPMKGEPYVWGRINKDTLTVFSMFVGPNGDYEIQQYDRTLAEGGLELVYSSHRNGYPLKRVQTFLSRQ